MARAQRLTASRAAVLALCVLSMVSCRVGELQLKNDHRLSFQSPKARERVTTPLTITWTMDGFDAVGLDGSSDPRRGVFAVFVDRAPMPLGKDLKWSVRDDKGCQRDPRCPDANYLADRGVHITTVTSLTLDVLPRVAAGGRIEQHYINIVLLDGSGRRIGESAWYRPFTTAHGTST